MAGMTGGEKGQVDVVRVREMLGRKKQMKAFLSVCASCGLCARSCFLYQNHQDYKYMPSYKAIHSLGKIFKARGRVSRDDLEAMTPLIWGRCVMCERCYCPFGIDIASMISWARSICRSQGVYERYDLSPMGSAGPRGSGANF
jgi:heterodisulfide reductase subunit C